MINKCNTLGWLALGNWNVEVPQTGTHDLYIGCVRETGNSHIYIVIIHAELIKDNI
jgi:hypothetical protein